MPAWISHHYALIGVFLGVWSAVASAVNRSFWPRPVAPPAPRWQIVIHAMLVDAPAFLPALNTKGPFGLPFTIPLPFPIPYINLSQPTAIVAAVKEAEATDTAFRSAASSSIKPPTIPIFALLFGSLLCGPAALAQMPPPGKPSLPSEIGPSVTLPDEAPVVSALSAKIKTLDLAVHVLAQQLGVPVAAPVPISFWSTTAGQVLQVCFAVLGALTATSTTVVTAWEALRH